MAAAVRQDEQPSDPDSPSNQTDRHAVPTDLALADRCRRGDATAFEELYRRHATRLYNLLYRMLGSQADAEDQLQEVFLQAYRKLETFRGESALSTWLYRLAHNLCLDHLRSKAGKRERVTDALDETRTHAGASGAPPGELIVHRLDLERAIGRLPEGCRAAFILHDVEGFDHRQVGAILGIAEGTSKSQVHKARLRIRAYLRRSEP